MEKIHEEDMRAIAAILLKIPTSGIKWLDSLIKISRHQDIADAVLQGIISHEGISKESAMADIDLACKVADAMIKGK